MAGGFQADGRISYSSKAWVGMYLEVAGSEFMVWLLWF